MFRHLHHPIQIGTRVRSYELPGVSDADFITGTVVGRCTMANLPRFIIESISLTIHGQEEPCVRIFYEPIQSVVSEQDLAEPTRTLNRVA
jgi:hypothetical protein